MRNLSRIAAMAGGIVACNVIAWTSMVGCSGDDNAIPDGGDAAPDNTQIDVFVPDVQGQDVVGDEDAGTNPDAPYDAASLLAFPAEEALASCGRLRTCCYGADAGVALTKCIGHVSPLGINGTLVELSLPGVLDGGHLHLDETTANSCLAALSTFSCPVMPESEYRNVTQNCYGAVSGTLPIGAQGCKTSVECVPGAYCAAATAPDGGPTKECYVVGDAGSPCTASNIQCMYRGYLGQNQLRCAIDGGSTGTCGPQLQNGAKCNYSFDCLSQTCDETGHCGTAFTLTDPGTCDYLFYSDAGL